MSDRDNEKPTSNGRDRRRGTNKNSNGRRRGGRSRGSSAAYRQRIDEKLFGKRGDSGRYRREERLREAHGSPTFMRIFREYVKDFGMPDDVPLLVSCLDLEEERDLLRVIEALGGALDGAPIDHRNLLRKRLQNLEMTAGTDAVGDATEGLLARM